jgi:hypothetical protein
VDCGNTTNHGGCHPTMATVVTMDDYPGSNYLELSVLVKKNEVVNITLSNTVLFITTSLHISTITYM